MGSDKTYIFDGGGTGGGLDIAALVSSMMSNKGMDPNLVAALMNGNNNRGSWGGDGYGERRGVKGTGRYSRYRRR